MFHSIKVKAVIYACLVHVGLAVSLTALIRESATMSTLSFGLALAGVGLMYSSFLFSALSIYIPLRPWLARYQRARAWRGWVLQELPTLLALIPVAITALRVLKSAWAEIKTYQQKGELNVQNLATVAQKFATEAEGLAEEPGVQKVRERFKEAA